MSGLIYLNWLSTVWSEKLLNIDVHSTNVISCFAQSSDREFNQQFSARYRSSHHRKKESSDINLAGDYFATTSKTSWM